jgi:acetylornithine deacetylase
VLDDRERRALAELDVAALARDLSELVAVPSLTGDERAAQERVVVLMQAADLAVDSWPIDLDALRRHPRFSAETRRSEAIGVVGALEGFGGGRGLILNAHVDAVPPGDTASWTYPPWSGTIADGRVHGRGALDDKAGVVCAVHAARALRAAGVRLGGRLLVESVVGEEDGGTGTLATILAGYSADSAVVVEPTELRVVPAQAGALSFRLTVPGLAAHGCVREEGVSAVEKFRPLHDALLALEAERNGRARDRDAANDRPLYSAHRLPIPLCIGRVHAGEWNSTVPECLVAEGRYGIDVGESPAAAQREFEAAVATAADADPWLRKHRPRIEWPGGRFESALTPLDAPIVGAVSDAFEAVTGLVARLEGVTYGADMRLLVNEAGIPTVLFGPGDVRGSHRPDESVAIDDLETATRTLIVSAMRFCGCET